MNEQKSSEEIVILNVGGIKYETYRSTLSKYPNTLLGTMFNPNSHDQLKPVNGNEYFFDRNGYAFKHVLEFYRTGKILWPNTKEQQKTNTFQVTNKELEIELDHFQIDSNLSCEMKLEVAIEMGGQELNRFLIMLNSMICSCVEKLTFGDFSFTFYRDKNNPDFKYGKNNQLSHFIFELNSFQYNGYFILKYFGEVHKCCTLVIYVYGNRHELSISNLSILKNAILNHSMLNNVDEKK